MGEVLLFDSGCMACSSLAEAVEKTSSGRITAASIGTKEMQDVLNQAKPDWKWEPSLLEIGESETTVSTGLAMRLKLLRRVGPLRALSLLRLIARTEIDQQSGLSRKNFIRLAGATFVAATGLGAASTQPVRADGRDRKDPQLLSTGIVEGVISYDVIDELTTESTRIHYTHEQPDLSGTFEAESISDGNSEYRLIRGDTIAVAISLHSSEKYVEVTGSDGNTERIDFPDEDLTSEPEIVTQNLTDIKLASAIFTDVETWLQEPLLTNPTPNLACPCATSGGLRGQGDGGGRTAACERAARDASSKCWNGCCTGCCRWVGGSRYNCDCACLAGDYVCHCGITGYPCLPGCNPSC